MALLKDIIIANAALSTLTPEQIAAIETLSANDENQVIAKKTSEVYNEMDTKIVNITGIKREGDEKSYNYFERAVKQVKDTAKDSAGLQTKVTELEAEKTRLEGLIQSGAGNEELKAQLDKAQKDLQSVQSQYGKLQKDNSELVAKHAGEMIGYRLDNDLQAALTGISFKKEIPEASVKMIINATLSGIKNMNPEYVKDADGNETLIFKDAQGLPIRNTQNALHHITAAELVNQELNKAGIVAVKQNAAGAGTGAGTPTGGNGGATMDLSGAKSKVEAMKIIETNLLERGLVRGSDEFESETNKAFVDNSVNDLPTTL